MWLLTLCTEIPRGNKLKPFKHVFWRSKMNQVRFYLELIGILFISYGVAAAVPKVINYQGSLSDNNGPVGDPNLQMVFSIYDVLTGGTALWTETHTVKVTNGNYNVLLGNQTSFPEDLFENEILYLGIKAGNDLEITPRTQIASTPSALRAL